MCGDSKNNRWTNVCFSHGTRQKGGWWYTMYGLKRGCTFLVQVGQIDEFMVFIVYVVMGICFPIKFQFEGFNRFLKLSNFFILLISVIIFKYTSHLH